MTVPTKIDSNLTGLNIAEETTLKVLPGTLEADAVWYAQEPNSFSDFGGELSTVARTPINASRQRKKGTVTGLEASGGFNTDLTMNNLTRLLQGFFFADAHEKANTQAMNSAAIVITAVSTTDDSFAAASGLDAFKVNDIVLASGFSNSANNGLHVVTTSASGKITVGTNLTNEAAPPATAKLIRVGHQGAASDLRLVASATSIALTSEAGGVDLTTLGLNAGEWIFIGGDATGLKFADSHNVPGFARIVSIAAHLIQLDQCTFVATTDTGAAKTIQIFFGTFLRNESDPSLIKRRSYNLERSLGNDGTDIQSELLLGSISNELTLNIPQADKINTDLNFVALDHIQRTGTEGLKDGDRIAALGEDAINTSNDVYRMRMNVVDPTNLLNDSLFGYLSEVKLTVKNGVSPNKAIGVLGAFEASIGNFEVDGTMTAYFSTVAAIAAIRLNSDVAFNLIFAKENQGLVFDVPLCGLGGGRLSIEKDAPVTIPVKSAAAENSAGYTLSYTSFLYLPDAAMPT